VGAGPFFPIARTEFIYVGSNTLRFPLHALQALACRWRPSQPECQSLENEDIFWWQGGSAIDRLRFSFESLFTFFENLSCPQNVTGLRKVENYRVFPLEDARHAGVL
jgi:hypothetical protein